MYKPIFSVIKTNFELVETRVDWNVVQTVLAHRDPRLCNRPVQLIDYGFTVNMCDMEMQYTFTQFSKQMKNYTFSRQLFCWYFCLKRYVLSNVFESYNPPIDYGRTESINNDKYRFLNKCSFAVVTPIPDQRDDHVARLRWNGAARDRYRWSLKPIVFRESTNSHRFSHFVVVFADRVALVAPPTYAHHYYPYCYYPPHPGTGAGGGGGGGIHHQGGGHQQPIYARCPQGNYYVDSIFFPSATLRTICDGRPCPFDAIP